MVWLLPAGLIGDPVGWHLHELLFGMGGAAVGGYLLTALPSWTGTRVPAQTLRALTVLWVMARFALPLSEVLPFGLLAMLALGYFGLLALVLTRALIGARKWSRLWSVAVVAGLALGDAIFLGDLRDVLDAPSAPLVSVVMFAGLISAIGGRAIAAFTRSWLLQSDAPMTLHDRPVLSALALAATMLGASLILAEQEAGAGVFLLMAGVLQGVRLTGWHTLHARHYLALFLLHMAWIWVPVGLILLGAAMLRPDVIPQSTALHGLTMGAMGTMILAISGRAAMARRGNRLIVDRGLALAFTMVWLAALLRVASPILAQDWPNPVTMSAMMWMLGWAAFLWAFRPALQGDLPWPILSAQRRERKTGPVQDGDTQARM